MPKRPKGPDDPRRPRVGGGSGAHRPDGRHGPPRGRRPWGPRRGPVVLRIETGPPVSGPDTVTLGFEDPAGEVTVLAEVDGRHLSTEVTGGFMGRVLGLYAVGGDAAFDWFDYEEVL